MISKAHDESAPQAANSSDLYYVEFEDYDDVRCPIRMTTNADDLFRTKEQRERNQHKAYVFQPIDAVKRFRVVKVDWQYALQCEIGSYVAAPTMLYSWTCWEEYLNRTEMVKREEGLAAVARLNQQEWHEKGVPGDEDSTGWWVLERSCAGRQQADRHPTQHDLAGDW